MKTITIRMSDNAHYKLKSAALSKRITLQKLIQNELEKIVPDVNFCNDEEAKSDGHK